MYYYFVTYQYLTPSGAYVVGNSETPSPEKITHISHVRDVEKRIDESFQKVGQTVSCLVTSYTFLREER